MMGRFFTILAALCAICGWAQNRTMFVHHDGNVDIFLYASIDSIRYSPIDIDSVNVGYPVVQEICTVDSVYRYNIADIDSVTFQTPSTVAYPGTVDLAVEHMPYIIGLDDSNGLILKLSSSTPTSLIPEKGTNLYQLNPSEALPYGFVGCVDRVEFANEEINLECSDVPLDEIFEQLAWTGQTIFSPSQNIDTGAPQSRAQDDYNNFWLSAKPTYPDYISGVISMTDELRDIPVGPEVAQIEGYVAIQPNIICYVGDYVIPLSDGTSVKRKLISTHVKTNVRANAHGRYIVEDNKEHKAGSNDKLTLTLPIGLGQTCKLTYVGTLAIKGSCGIDYEYQGQYKSVIDTKVTYNNDGYGNIECQMSHLPLSAGVHSLDASMDGKLALTGSMTLTHVQSGDSLKSISNTISYGSALNGSALLKTSQIARAATNDSLYRALTSTGIEAKPIENISASAKYASLTLKAKITQNTPSGIKYYLVPKFTSPNYDAMSKTMRYNIQGMPMQMANSHLGLAIKAGNNDLQWIETNEVWPNTTRDLFAASVDFDSQSGDYLYPSVTLPWEQRILAAPQYPYVSDCIFPVITAVESQGTKFVSGAPILGQGVNEKAKTIVIIGNMLLVPQK